MSEYWVSKKRYWCKYCKISIADDAPSRQHHEGGLRHKGNVDRYIRDIYKTGEKRKKDAAEEERELARINAAAERAYANDVGSGAAKAGSSSSSLAPARPAPAPAAAATAKPPPKPLDKFANYSTAESLGFVDESIAEAERRRNEGIIGNWEVVLPTASSKSKEKEDTWKRVLQVAQTEERAAAESSRNFRVGERKVGAGLEDIWEPEVPIRVKAKSEQTLDSAEATPEVKPKIEVDYGLPKATEMPVWKAMSWSKPGEVTKQEDGEEVKQEEVTGDTSTGDPEPTTTEAAPPPAPSPPIEPPVKAEPQESKLEEAAAGNSLFRKRKGAPSTAGTRNQKKR